MYVFLLVVVVCFTQLVYYLRRQQSDEVILGKVTEIVPPSAYLQTNTSQWEIVEIKEDQLQGLEPNYSIVHPQENVGHSGKLEIKEDQLQGMEPNYSILMGHPQENVNHWGKLETKDDQLQRVEPNYSPQKEKGSHKAVKITGQGVENIADTKMNLKINLGDLKPIISLQQPRSMFICYVLYKWL
jgi:hypothetical protein